MPCSRRVLFIVPIGEWYLARLWHVACFPAQAMATDPLDSAREAGLRYVGAGEPGIRRERHGRGFAYIDHAGERVTDAAEIRRFRRLAIPPAWTQVWICRDPFGHIQATG